MAQHAVDACQVMVGGVARRAATTRLHWDADTVDHDRAFVAALVHPHVVAIHDLDREGSITVAWTDGTTLNELMHACVVTGRQVPPPIAARIVADISAGLGFVRTLRNSRGDGLRALYRRLEPGNILVGLDGVTRLVDFGWHYVPDGGLRLYVSPFESLDELYGEPADAWAVGCALYWLLAGRLPFTTDRGELDMLQQIRRNHPPPLDAARIPPELRLLCDRALQTDARRRLPSAAAVHDVAAAWLWASSPVTPADVASFVGEVSSSHVERLR